MKPFDSKKKLKFETEENKKGKRSRLITISFVVFILLLGTVSTIYFLKTYDYNLSNVFGKEQDTTGAGEEEEPTIPTKLDGGATFLLAASSTNKDQLYFAALAKVDLKKMQVKLTCLPVNAVVDTGSGSETLESSFVSGGAQKLAQTTSKYSGIKIDRYVVVGEKNFKKVISYVGNYTLVLDEKLTYNGGDYSLNFVKGKQTLTGDKLLHYIRYQEKQGGSYLNNQSRILCDVIDQLTNISNFEQGEELFNKLINIVDSDISIIDYTKYQPYIKAYIESDNRKPTISVDLSDLKD